MKCSGTGAAYAFSRSGATWSQQAYLKAREQDRGDSLGGAIAISADGNTVVAGAADEDSMTTGVDAVKSGDSGEVGAADDTSSGASYAFVRAGADWTEHASFKASNTGAFDEFGSSIAVSGDGHTVAVGARFEDSGATGVNGNEADNSVTDAGAVYAFGR